MYADARLAVDHGLAVAAAALVLPAGGVFAGRSAAWLYGIAQAGAEDPVDVLVPLRTSWWAPPGLSVHVGADGTDDVTVLGRRPVTVPARTGVDIARWYAAPAAVPLIDAMLAVRLVSPAVLRTQLTLASGQGKTRASATLALCDHRAESPPESVLRVLLAMAGLPDAVPQYEVRHAGRFVARVDLAWPAAKVAVEYDGAWHGAPGQLGRDRRRLNALIAAGWTVIHVTATDMHDLSAVVGQVRATLELAA